LGIELGRPGHLTIASYERIKFRDGGEHDFTSSACIFLCLTATCRLHGPGANGNMLWERTSFFFTLQNKLTRLACTSKGVYCCHGLKLTTCAFVRSVTWETPHSHIFPRTRKYGEKTMMTPEIGPPIHGELPASWRSTTSRLCSGKASHCICVIPFAMVVWIRTCTPLALCLICA
jgi:hypothetical protein